jgi:glycerophosphoryl diester phosphodiesterase
MMELSELSKILGHRGWSAKYPENTCLAFSKALGLGVAGIEFDVQLSKDGVPVIIHDETIDRTTNGTGRVSSFTTHELKKFNATANGQYPNSLDHQSIPTLDEVMGLAYGFNQPVLCNVELKVYQGDGRDVVDEVLRRVPTYTTPNHVLYSSFHHGCLAYLRQRSRDARIGLLFEKKPVDPWQVAKDIDACSVNLDYHHATPDLIEACHQHGLQVCVWTVDEPVDIASFIQCRTEIVITNTPDRAMEVCRGVTA